MPISDLDRQNGVYAEHLAPRYRQIRSFSERLCAPLEIEDYGIQPMPEASPPKWHLAHTSWFFETFILKPWVKGYQPFHQRYEFLFNSYYNGIGTPFERARRGTLSRPTVAEIYEYRHFVDEHLQAFLEHAPLQACERIELGLHHEQQHQELLLTDIKYNFGRNPLLPAYQTDAVPPAAQEAPAAGQAPAAKEEPAAEAEMIEQPAGLISIGARSGQFCFDNELPVHSYYLQPHALASRLITNAQYREFIDDGGYQQPQLWLSDGWSWLQLNPDVRAPLYWVERDGQWFEYHLNGLMSLQEQAPVCHVSFYEADAFARWRGMRLPLEQEWEAAASTEPEGHFIDLNHLRPLPAPQGSGLQQMYGDVWQWTQSAYLPYPGFAPAGGAIGEYNGKFMSGQRVLRGGSCVTSRDHIRSSYRNFFYPQDRWQFSGIRLACDLPS